MIFKELRPFAAKTKNWFRDTALWLKPAGDFPGLVIIGAQKAGTTSLYTALSKHPDIVSSRMKEVHFADKNWARGDEWYRRCFPNIEGMGLEATPNYLFHPLSAQRISKTVPASTKFIAILRDPVKRAISHHHYEVSRGGETLCLSKALKLELDRTNLDWEKAKSGGKWTFSLQHHSYKRRGLYGMHLENWIDFVGQERLFILEDKNLYHNSHNSIIKICEFAGIRTDQNLNVPKANIGKYKNKTSISPEFYEYFRDDADLLQRRWGNDFTWFRKFT
jgi:hypothetical protein